MRKLTAAESNQVIAAYAIRDAARQIRHDSPPAGQQIIEHAKPDDGDRDAALVEAMARATFAVEFGNGTDLAFAPNAWLRHLAMNVAALAAYRAHQEAF